MVELSHIFANEIQKEKKEDYLDNIRLTVAGRCIKNFPGFQLKQFAIKCQVFLFSNSKHNIIQTATVS